MRLPLYILKWDMCEDWALYYTSSREMFLQGDAGM